MGRKAKDNSSVQDPGQSIREKRLALGWTVETLAKKSGISTGSISRIENGTQNFTIGKIRKIAAAFGCDVPDLFSGRSEKAQAYLLQATPEQIQAVLDIFQSKKLPE